MLGDTSIPLSARKDWVWEQVAVTHPEIRRQNFSFDDPYMFHEIVARDCYGYKPKPGDTVLDIGANVGVFTAMCALGGARVLAYEPHPGAFEVLLDTIRRNDIQELVTPVEAAIDWKYGHYSFHPNAMLCDGWTAFNGNTENPTVSVPAYGFEDVLRRTRSRWSCVKMDIEGAEFKLLYMLPLEVFDTVNFLTVEFHNGWATKQLHDDVISRLREVFDITGVQDGDPVFAGQNRFQAVHCTRRNTSS